MKVVIAPDKFKASLDSNALCHLIRRQLSAIKPRWELIKLPLSDGGDGFERVIHHYAGGEWVEVESYDALMQPTSGKCLYRPASSTAFVSVAQCNGLALLAQPLRNPMVTTSYGTGVLINAAIARGAKTIVVGLGGSATCDAGMGLLQALGFSVEIDGAQGDIVTGGILHRIFAIHRPAKLPEVQFILACDVDNLLFGPSGAAHVFAGQKGANAAERVHLDHGLRHVHDLLTHFTNKPLAELSGGGAAGGMGIPLATFFNATFNSGAQLALEASGFREKIGGADWIITAEGRLDASSLNGKLPVRVAQMGKEAGAKVLCITGECFLDVNQWRMAGFDAVISLRNGGMPLEECISNAPDLVQTAISQWALSLGA